MYPLKPTGVYALKRALDRPHWVARMDRILAAIGFPRERVVEFDEDELPDVLGGMAPERPPDDAGHPPDPWTRPLIFTAIELTEPRRDLSGLIERCPESAPASLVRDVCGQITLVRPTHPRRKDWDTGCVCWPTMDFGVMRGCPHGCLYCPEGKWGRRIAVALNLEEYVEQVVTRTILENPWQRCFRMIGWGADLLTFEPENGLFRLFTDKLAEYEDRYGYFHTGSDNVDWIAELPHRG